MNILFFGAPNKGLYYEQFYKKLNEKANVCLYSPDKSYYDSSHDIHSVLSIFKKETGIGEPDLILFGYGWEDDNSGYNYKINHRLSVADIKIKKAFIFNKEYKKLEQKIDFVTKNKIDVCFTALHETNCVYEKVRCPIYRLPFAANFGVFKDYKKEKTIDLGFSGNLFNSKVYTDPKTNIMGKYFNNVRSRIFNELCSHHYKDMKIWWNSNHSKNLYGEQYSMLMNSSKVWLNTTSAIELVGTRFFEIMGSCSLLFCLECPWAYKGLGIVDGETCVTFKNDLSNFEEKLYYYLEKDAERERIIKNAHKLFRENHTWGHRVDFLLNTIENIKGGFNG